MTVNITKEPQSCRVTDFYAGRCVFITGGTGFLGKVLIEKLLYNCRQIDTIYVLIREKRDMAADIRLLEIINNPLFSRLKEERPQDLKKIIPISGDIGAPNLGIKPEDEELLIEKVSVVFHAAATIKFNEPLKQALKINLEGTAQVLSLCQRMKHIQILVHTSTAYTNTDRQIIDEIIYPPPADVNNVYLYMKQQDDDEYGTRILNGRPNTYTFTKALAECFVAESHGNVPTVIVRPSIVSAIEDGPMQGWIDNWYGATGILTMIAKGHSRILLGDRKHVVDLIPVDYVVNFLIIAAAKTTRSDEVAVYNCCSSSCNPISLGQLIQMFVQEAVIHRDYVIPLPKINFVTMYYWLVPIVTLCLQTIPAYLADFWRLLRGKPPRYIKLQSRLVQSRDALEYFTSHSWLMRSERARALFNTLCARDRLLFPCDPTSIDWTKYIPIYCAGIRKYLVRKN